MHPWKTQQISLRLNRPTLSSLDAIVLGHLTSCDWSRTCCTSFEAIATGRVGHAYLFTGARGVGKTSTARIFAKALNLQEGVAGDLADEITAAVDSGDDIDVIEIDGASNRGINEIRQLRANVNVRPSRARFKIYIIDRVDPCSKEAFNAPTEDSGRTTTARQIHFLHNRSRQDSNHGFVAMPTV